MEHGRAGRGGAGRGGAVRCGAGRGGVGWGGAGRGRAGKGVAGLGRAGERGKRRLSAKNRYFFFGVNHMWKQVARTFFWRMLRPLFVVQVTCGIFFMKKKKNNKSHSPSPLLPEAVKPVAPMDILDPA